MAFDLKGQADTLERRVEISKRAYHILVDHVGFLPEGSTILDPNIFAIATGIEEHSNYGKDFIEATRRIKHMLPYAKVSGGLSNISFSFAATTRCARRSTRRFVRASRPGHGDSERRQIGVYDEIPKELLEHVEDIIFSGADAAEPMATLWRPSRAAGVCRWRTSSGERSRFQARR